MLTGLYGPSTGTAYLNNNDVRTQIRQVRSSLGICPQFNILFDELTVEEHLEFYCKLKHTPLTNKQIKQEIKKMVESLDLVEKRKTISAELSGGMKRKLSVSYSKVFEMRS